MYNCIFDENIDSSYQETQNPNSNTTPALDIFELSEEEQEMQKAIKTAKEALKMNLSFEQIAKLTGLSEEKILQLSKEISNQ
jgi:transcriptional regulator GlxA family with amidase domain